MATRSNLKRVDSQPSMVALDPKNWREGENRSERGRLIREGLFKAAAEIVGDVGYKEASVAMIVQRAGVAQGTFYNHFANRQDIFDQLLPATGEGLLAYVRACANEGKTMLEKEELSFTAFFSFLSENPHFFRILNEAESFAPKAYRTHLELVAKGYRGFLQHAHERGELPDYEDRDLEVVVFMLMAARSYLAWRFVYGAEKQGTIPEWVTGAYMKFIKYGLAGRTPAARDAERFA
jgi:AcrR family transcriptional regulator